VQALVRTTPRDGDGQAAVFGSRARLFAFTSMMLVDGWIASCDAKFTYNQWRPVTDIREADTDDKPSTQRDPHWSPEPIWTPAFPDYVSAHCTISAIRRRITMGAPWSGAV
jgi:hypothetical protein